MNFENPTTPAEREPALPTLAEIVGKIEEFTRGEQAQILRTLEDEKGIYLHEAITTDESGDDTLYRYHRSGNFVSHQRLTTGIDVAYYVGTHGDGMAVGGTSLAEYDEISRTWKNCE